jgi:RNA polymerase II subunit A small phosphatase-like protein
MSGERDSAPESSNKAPMSTSGLPGAIGKLMRSFLCVILYLEVIKVANIVPSVGGGPEQGHGNDATEIQDATAIAPSDLASASAVPAESTSAATEGANAPKKRHLLIPIPSRRSSKVNKQQESEKAGEAAQDEPARRGSKVSILRSKRDQSRASSRRSRQTQDGANAEESKEVASAPDDSSSKPQQKKGSSKLLAFLGCCSSSDLDADDTALPAKKTTMRAPVSNRLPTPDKAEAQTGDSSTVESREPYLDEKANSTVSADQHGEENRNVQGTAAGVQRDGPLDVPQAEASGQNNQTEEVAPLAQQAAPEVRDANNNDLGGQSDTTADKLSPAPTSAMPTSFNTDGSNSPDSHEEVASQEEVAQPMTVPPPPPLPPAPPGPPARGYSEDAAHPLLPPLLPHLSGRKCLVLDLDETLVHSSFKVSFFLNLNPPFRRIVRSFH